MPALRKEENFGGPKPKVALAINRSSRSIWERMLLDGMICCLNTSELLAEYRELALVLPFGEALFNGSVSYLIYTLYEDVYR